MIEKNIRLAASPAEVYSVLTSAKDFSQLSGGAPAEVRDDAGASFSLFGGMIEGRNVECSPGIRLVQAWRPKSWAPGDYSLVRFELEEDSEGTKLLLVHSGFPKEQREHLSAGWDKNYLEPLQKRFS